MDYLVYVYKIPLFGLYFYKINIPMSWKTKVF